MNINLLVGKSNTYHSTYIHVRYLPEQFLHIVVVNLNTISLLVEYIHHIFVLAGNN